MCHSLEMRSELSAPLPPKLICHSRPPVSLIQDIFPLLLSLVEVKRGRGISFSDIGHEEKVSENKHLLSFLSPTAPECKEISLCLSAVPDTVLASSRFHSEKSKKVTCLSAVVAWTLTSCV